MKFLYFIIISLYYLGIWLAFPFKRKARKWILGRRGLFSTLEGVFTGEGKWIWFHCASLGEFEQGRPVIEAIREQKPGLKILVSFFSPSGYDIRKNYTGADLVCYLPFDFPWNAKRFVSLVQPVMAVFVKYEFWLYTLHHLRKRNIPHYGISVIVRENHPFLKWYGRFYRTAIGSFDHLFLQDSASLERLKSAGFARTSLAGDTRFDRVTAIAGQAKDIAYAKEFSGGMPVVVAGSTWGKDEELLIRFMKEEMHEAKWIIAPHETTEDHISRIMKSAGDIAVRYSHINQDNAKNYRLLVIDNVGMLSFLYRYASVAYIGGGFGKGIHNVPEAAVYGIPVIFGPRYHKFNEAIQLIEENAAFSVNSYEGLRAMLTKLLTDDKFRIQSGKRAGAYVHKSAGATQKIVDKLLNSC